MGINLILLFFTFSGLTLLGLLSRASRQRTLSRSRVEWLYDGLGLFIQGVVIPATPFLIIPVLSLLFPTLQGRYELPALVQILLSFVLVDYLYYWNHRSFHKKEYWNLHRLHHSSRLLDVFATSRNSLITSFLFVYFWVQIGAMFLLKDSTPFMLGLAVTFALDLYRHSGLPTPGWLHQLLSPVLIMPEEHTLHHSLKGRNRNYGANLCWWDKLHGTYSREVVTNEDLEKVPQGSVLNHILTPWRKSS